MQFESPLGDARLTNRKSPARQPLDPVAFRHRIAAAMSSAMTYVLTGFALCAGSMYPELLWPLFAQLDGCDSTEEPPSPGAPERISTQKVHEFPPKGRPSLGPESIEGEHDVVGDSCSRPSVRRPAFFLEVQMKVLRAKTGGNFPWEC